MSSIWDFGIPLMMKTAGKICKITVDGVTLEFSGILDQAEIADESELGMIIRMASVLRVDRIVAQKLKGLTNIAVEVDGVEYIMQEPIAEGDGATSVCPIYPKVDGTRVGWV